MTCMIGTRMFENGHVYRVSETQILIFLSPFSITLHDN
jgi:hypothetical protein